MIIFIFKILKPVYSCICKCYWRLFIYMCFFLNKSNAKGTKDFFCGKLWMIAIPPTSPNWKNKTLVWSSWLNFPLNDCHLDYITKSLKRNPKIHHFGYKQKFLKTHLYVLWWVHPQLTQIGFPMVTWIVSCPTVSEVEK
jgi:hypothetical protein